MAWGQGSVAGQPHSFQVASVCPQTGGVVEAGCYRPGDRSIQFQGPGGSGRGFLIYLPGAWNFPARTSARDDQTTGTFPVRFDDEREGDPGVTVILLGYPGSGSATTRMASGTLTIHRWARGEGIRGSITGIVVGGMGGHQPVVLEFEAPY
jgi:hypothetical protein